MSEPISREALLNTIENLTFTNERIILENDRLRGLLAKGQGDCIYCGLSAENIAKCPHGFPGCARMDDIVNAQEMSKDDEIVHLRESLRKSILLARRTAWIAYVWNDHNFGPAHVMAREECEAHGIRSFAEANAFLESADKLIGEG